MGEATLVGPAARATAGARPAAQPKAPVATAHAPVVVSWHSLAQSVLPT
jgi:hypothetical protein